MEKHSRNIIYICSVPYVNVFFSRRLLTHMLWDYRSEKWWYLISDILQKALNCAYLSANIQDYVTLSLEILSGHTNSSSLDKTKVFKNLTSVLKVNSILF